MMIFREIEVFDLLIISWKCYSWTESSQVEQEEEGECSFKHPSC